MKTLLLLAVTVLFSFPIDVEGVWTSSVPGEEGSVVPVTLTFDADTYKADFANDGTIDVRGTYSISKDQISLKDAEDLENPCPGVGLYTIRMDGNEMRLELVSDECDIRKNSLKTMVMTRK